PEGFPPPAIAGPANGPRLRTRPTATNPSLRMTAPSTLSLDECTDTTLKGIAFGCTRGAPTQHRRGRQLAEPVAVRPLSAALDDPPVRSRIAPSRPGIRGRSAQA